MTLPPDPYGLNSLLPCGNIRCDCFNGYSNPQNFVSQLSVPFTQNRLQDTCRLHMYKDEDPRYSSFEIHLSIVTSKIFWPPVKGLACLRITNPMISPNFSSDPVSVMVTDDCWVKAFELGLAQVPLSCRQRSVRTIMNVTVLPNLTCTILATRSVMDRRSIPNNSACPWIASDHSSSTSIGIAPTCLIRDGTPAVLGGTARSNHHIHEPFQLHESRGITNIHPMRTTGKQIIQGINTYLAYLSMHWPSPIAESTSATYPSLKLGKQLIHISFFDVKKFSHILMHKDMIDAGICIVQHERIEFFERHSRRTVQYPRPSETELNPVSGGHGWIAVDAPKHIFVFLSFTRPIKSPQ